MTTSIMYRKGNVIISEPTNYQGFEYDIEKNICTPTGHRTQPKWSAVKEVFSKIIPGNSFFDIGANMGFFCFKALEYHTSKSIGIEANHDYFNSVNQVSNGLIEYIFGTFPVIIKSDVTMALSLIHHLSRSYSLEKIASQLSSVTNKFLIVEWVGRGDRTEVKYNYAKDHEWENFKTFLSEYFSEITFINNGHHDSRKIYLCKK